MRSTRVVLIVALTGLLALCLLAGCGGGGQPPAGTGEAGITSQTDNATDNGLQRVLIGFRDRPGAAQENWVHGEGGRVKRTFTLVSAMAASLPPQAIEALRHNPNVTIVEPDAQVTATADTLPWGVDRIDAEIVQATGNTGAGVKVAVLDTGIDYKHPDLDGNYKGGYDFVNKDADPMDDNGHGTHVAGTIAAERDGSGVVGVAPGASLYAVKVLAANGGGNYSDIIAGLQWCVTNGIQVANMSLGSTTVSTTLETACNNAYAAGVVLVAAAGNNGTTAGTGDNVLYPARYASVIAVAATDSADKRITTSSTGSTVALSAPGQNIYSTARGGGYATMSGTSMACPHVSGAAALVIASGLASGPQAVRDRLTKTADDLGTVGRDALFGFGLVDADEAAGAVVPPPAMHVASIVMTKLTSSVKISSGKATVTIVDAAGKAVSGAVVSGTWSGLATDKDTGTTATDGTVTVQSDTTKLTKGTFTFTVTGVTKSGWVYASAANVKTSASISLP